MLSLKCLILIKGYSELQNFNTLEKAFSSVYLLINKNNLFFCNIVFHVSGRFLLPKIPNVSAAASVLFAVVFTWRTTWHGVPNHCIRINVQNWICYWLAERTDMKLYLWCDFINLDDKDVATKINRFQNLLQSFKKIEKEGHKREADQILQDYTCTPHYFIVHNAATDNVRNQGNRIWRHCRQQKLNSLMVGGCSGLNKCVTQLVLQSGLKGCVFRMFSDRIPKKIEKYSLPKKKCGPTSCGRKV